MVSIRQNAYPDLLPDFRNLGVIARLLLAVNGLAVAGVLFAESDFSIGLDQFVRTAAYIEPLLLIELMALAALSPLFRLHGSVNAGTHTPWSFDQETVELYDALSRLHLAARPLILRLWRETTPSRNGYGTRVNASPA